MYLGETGSSAIDLGLREVSWTASSELTQIMVSIEEDAKGFPLKRMLIWQALGPLLHICEAASENRLARSLDLSLLHDVAAKLDKDAEEVSARNLVSSVKDILTDITRSGIIDWMNVVDIGVFGLQIAERFTEPAVRLIQAMGKAAEHLKGQPDFRENRQRQRIYEEMVRRIRQQRIARAPDRERIFSTVRTVLEELGKPELEERV